MKILILLASLVLIQNIPIGQDLVTIIQRHHAREGLQCWGKGISGLKPDKYLEDFVQKRFATDYRADLINKYISDTDRDIFKTLFRRDAMSYEKCDPDEFKGLFSSLSPKRKSLLTDLFYAMNGPEYEKFFLIKINFYGRRLEYRHLSPDIRSKFSEQEWIQAGREDLEKALAEIRKAEERHHITELSQDEIAYNFSPLSDIELTEILRYYRTDHFRYVVHNIEYAMYDTFFFNFQQLLLQ